MSFRAITIDVEVAFDDFHRAHQRAIQDGHSVDYITVSADVDIDEALEQATVDELRSALAREDEGYTQEQLDAIRDCICAARNGDCAIAAALLPRIFPHQAQIVAAEKGLVA